MDTNLSEYIRFVQFASLALYLCVLVLNTRWIINWKHKRLYGIPVLLLVVHVISYYLVYFLDVWNIIYISSSSEFFGSWSAIIRLQTAITLLLGEWIRLDKKRE